MDISIKHLGIESYFEEIMTGSDQGAEKELHLIALLKKMGIDPKDAVYVGDTSYDMKVATSLGMVALGAAWTNKARIIELMNENPDAVFTQPNLMKNWLEKRFEEVKINIDKQRFIFIMMIIVLLATFLFIFQK